MLTISFFNIVHGELEGGWQGSALPETSLLTGSAKAYVGPTIGPLVPYAGLGVGVYHESLAGTSDTGTLGSVFAGVKLKFPLGHRAARRVPVAERAAGRAAEGSTTAYFVAVGLHI